MIEKHLKWIKDEPGGERADLSGADLSGADLSGADLSGAYIGYKKARGLIVELEITADALRSSATSRKCRASKAKVLSITDVDGNPAGEQVESDYSRDFVYIVGETVEVRNFDVNRWNECAPGIHHFITREEAVKYIANRGGRKCLLRKNWPKWPQLTRRSMQNSV